MTRVKVAGLFAVLGMLVVPGGASAAPFTPELDLAYRLAIKYWGGEPENCTSLDRQIVPDDWLEGEAGAATQPDRPMPCVLWISRFLAAPDEFYDLCGTMIHEEGHLHGLGHSTDPYDVMAPASGLGIPHICKRPSVLLGKLVYWRESLRLVKTRCHRQPARPCWRDVNYVAHRLAYFQDHFWRFG